MCYSWKLMLSRRAKRIISRLCHINIALIIFVQNVSKLALWSKKKNLQVLKINNLQIISVPRAGVEPARLSASVFETDLSTDSNIWAESGCKGNSFFPFLQINL